ncbi:MAG: hypothetical protein FWC40_07385 [Proteobacteria bacterium]|nr:hypothetical protein [Pseudomonadota bacterium]
MNEFHAGFFAIRNLYTSKLSVILDDKITAYAAVRAPAFGLNSIYAVPHTFCHVVSVTWLCRSGFSRGFAGLYTFYVIVAELCTAFLQSIVDGSTFTAGTFTLHFDAIPLPFDRSVASDPPRLRLA